MGSRPGCLGAIGFSRGESVGKRWSQFLGYKLVFPFELGVAVILIELLGSAGAISMDESAGSDLLKSNRELR